VRRREFLWRAASTRFEREREKERERERSIYRCSRTGLSSAAGERGNEKAGTKEREKKNHAGSRKKIEKQSPVRGTLAYLK